MTNSSKPIDTIQQCLANYACELTWDDLTTEAIHATKVRIIDTLGALTGGFFGPTCQIARNLAARLPNPSGATVIGTRFKTTPDMAAFVNGTTARYVEMNDAYHSPGVFGGHPSDVIMPVLAVAEHAHASGREFMVAVVLAYEVYLRLADAVVNPPGFDYTNYICAGTALAAGKLLNLSSIELAHCISIAVVPNNALFQSRTGHLSMWKAAAAGQAGRAGVFAALLARAGMEGPHLPYEGKAGWCDHVARKRFSLDAFGGHGNPYKVQETIIKPRSLCAATISSVLAAEKVAPLSNIRDVDKVTVEVYKKAKDYVGTDENCWNPDSRETADHSIPYVVAATLIDGTASPRSLDDAHLWNPDLRALMKKIEVVENAEYTKAYGQHPVEHHTRITVIKRNGDQLVAKVGGDQDDLAAHKSDAEIENKFRGLTEDTLGARRSKAILARLWKLERIENVGEIPAAFVVS